MIFIVAYSNSNNNRLLVGQKLSLWDFVTSFIHLDLVDTGSQSQTKQKANATKLA